MIPEQEQRLIKEAEAAALKDNEYCTGPLQHEFDCCCPAFEEGYIMAAKKYLEIVKCFQKALEEIAEIHGGSALTISKTAINKYKQHL